MYVLFIGQKYVKYHLRSKEPPGRTSAIASIFTCFWIWNTPTLHKITPLHEITTLQANYSIQVFST